MIGYQIVSILGINYGLNPVSNMMSQSSHQYPKSLTFADLASVLPSEASQYSNNMSHPYSDPNLVGNYSYVPSNLPVISENSGNMSLTQALHHFMTNTNKNIIEQVSIFCISCKSGRHLSYVFAPF